MTMTPRERVLRAFKQKPGLPDRVPVQFEFCASLYEHFSKKLGIPMHYTKNLFEDVTYRISGNELRTAMGCDVVVTGAAERTGFAPARNPDGTWLNEYGMRMKQGQVYVEVVECPLANAQTVADVAAYPWPDPDAPGRYDDARALVKTFKDRYLIIGDIEVTVFSLAQMLVGMEKLLMDMACGEEYVIPLFEACAKFQTKIGLHLIECGVDAIWVGDDFGGQDGLLMSPAMFEEQLMPIYKQMIDCFKAANPKVIPILHCDGAVSKLLPQIREIGFEVFNPVQPGVPGHGPQAMKDGFGSLFAFWGAIDQQYLLPKGTDAELEADIQEKIAVLGAGGGYMISPAHILQSDVSPERVETFIGLCKKHGSVLQA
ncbi:MAG: uroporphyrinogen decarboxylase family protein [bacterium]